MSSTTQKLRLACALAALATLGLAISCRGFFVNPTLTSIAISPTAPQVEQGKTLQLQAFGTYDDGSRNQIRSGVSWSSSPATVASINANTGILTGVAPGTSTITASSQALSSTATATVFIVIDSISISPTSASVKSGGTQNFTVSAASNGGTLNLTSSATLTAEQGGTAVTTVTCSYNSSIPAQVCSTTAGTTGVFQIVASYSGSSLTATATLTVN
jgi:trimeric autotransporter adhesin